MIGATFVLPLRIKYIVSKWFMKTSNLIRTLFLLFMAIGASSSSFSQTAAVKPTVATGDVVSVATAKIVLQTKDGTLDVILSEKTEYKRVPPDNPSLKAAVASTFGEIGTGDKLIVSGIMSDD